MLPKVEAGMEKETEAMNKLLENELKYCFEKRKIQMARCRDSGGECIVDDKVKVAKEKTVKFFF